MVSLVRPTENWDLKASDMLTKRHLSLDWRGLFLHETILPDGNTEVFNNKQTYLETGKGSWESKDDMALHKLLGEREHGASNIKMMK